DTAKIGTQSNPVVATIATGEFLYGVAVNPAGTYVYVTDWAFSSRTGIVRVIDAGSNTLFKSISVGMFPVGIGVSPSGGRVFVGNQDGTVSVIDSATNTAVALPVTVGGNPLVFGAFVGSGPSAPSCDDQLASLRQQLDATTSTITNLQRQVQSLQQQLDAAKS